METTIEDLVGKRKVVDVFIALGKYMVGKSQEGENHEAEEYADRAILGSERAKKLNVTFSELKEIDPELYEVFLKPIKYCNENHGFEV